ncbi:MFS transporter [Cyanobacterium aponinum]|uniref:Major facilitator superfamily MFS_1 n=1 Tax=Cyanobacterium aponinum (strain PCC 10605) TaxID=755178 RepID=K9Z5W4_CYAAP|nr:MFS transporter [Cyanobacterium aponinum]AFZ54132.1 major facilitator superfamily MFS_1 [Cyanobacterium aponinum PCC 10605]
MREIFFNVKTFIILWLGQLFSAVGSAMTYFTLTLWVWQKTESATAIALILVFYQLPQVIITPLTGILIDRTSRKQLLIISDTGSAFCTISVGILAFLGTLQVWHIYLIASVIGCFGNIQSLTYSTLIPLILPEKHHTRASSMGAMVVYGAGIISPALAGVLFPLIGLFGITLIDMGTFAIAFCFILMIHIPHTIKQDQEKVNHLSNLTFGFRYIYSHPELLSMVIMVSLFSFFNDISETLYQPMILAKTDSNSQILGIVVAGGGLGGVVGGLIVSVWGGFKKLRRGIFTGFLGTGISILILALASLPSFWIIARFAWSFHHPLMMSSYMAIWYAKIPHHLQGRVFGADYLIGILVTTCSSLTAGVLSDRIFEPLLQSQYSLPSGSGMAFLIAISATIIILVSSKVANILD